MQDVEHIQQWIINLTTEVKRTLKSIKIHMKGMICKMSNIANQVTNHIAIIVTNYELYENFRLLTS